VWLSTIAPTTSIAWMLGILVLTIYLFAFEVVEVDEAAITIMIINSAAAPTFCIKDEINPTVEEIMGMTLGSEVPPILRILNSDIQLDLFFNF
jgi:hypothetical protein